MDCHSASRFAMTRFLNSNSLCVLRVLRFFLSLLMVHSFLAGFVFPFRVESFPGSPPSCCFKAPGQVRKEAANF